MGCSYPIDLPQVARRRRHISLLQANITSPTGIKKEASHITGLLQRLKMDVQTMRQALTG
jgi:hypothetical protein